jgi:hypothetical protein
MSSIKPYDWITHVNVVHLSALSRGSNQWGFLGQFLGNFTVIRMGGLLKSFPSNNRQLFQNFSSVL